MLRELWNAHWRTTHGRNWDPADGHAFVHGGAIAPFDTPIPALRFRAQGGSTMVKVFGGDPSATLKKGCSLLLDETVFVVKEDPRGPVPNKKDPSKPGGVRDAQQHQYAVRNLPRSFKVGFPTYIPPLSNLPATLNHSLGSCS